MKLINGPTVADAIADPENALAKLVRTESDDSKLVEEVFLRFLARKPLAAELEAGLMALQHAGDDHEQLLAKLASYEQTMPARQAEWERTAGVPTSWHVLDPQEMKSDLGATFAKKEDHSLFVSGTPGKDVYTIVAATDLTGITGVRLEALADAALPAGGPGRAMNGNFVLTELQMSLAAVASADSPVAVGLKNAVADFSQEGWPVGNAVDGNEARFINHSCEPNCDAVIDDGRIWIETITDVVPGEELAYDYAYVLEERHTPAAKRRFPCQCGAGGCRGTILARKR